MLNKHLKKNKSCQKHQNHCFPIFAIYFFNAKIYKICFTCYPITGSIRLFAIKVMLSIVFLPPKNDLGSSPFKVLSPYFNF